MFTKKSKTNKKNKNSRKKVRQTRTYHFMLLDRAKKLSVKNNSLGSLISEKKLVSTIETLNK